MEEKKLIELTQPAPGEKEIWKTCADYEEYEVSSFGRVKRKKTGRIMKPLVNGKNGYIRIHLQAGVEQKNGKYLRIHRLVAKTFFGEPDDPKKDQIDHIDRDPTNNYYKNLRWVTRKENIQNRKPYKEYSKAIYKGKTPIVLLNKDTLELIREFSCLEQASEELTLSIKSIRNNIRGFANDFGIGKFMTKEQYLKEIK